MLNSSKSILIHAQNKNGTHEEEQYLFAVNNTKAEYPRDKTIHQLFEEQVSKRPNNVAIVCENEQLTYHELNVKANQLARIFIEKGIGKDTLVGIMMEKSIDLFIGILAVLKAGGAYVPIDIEYPKERIQYILDDSQARMLLTQKHLVRLIHNIQFNGQVEIFEEDTIKIREGTNLHVPSKSTDLAYVIYTSGTTGNPKGTMLEHKGISNLKVFFENSLNVTEKDRIGQFASISFDASVWEMFMALLTGASLYIILKDTINDFVKFEQYINQKEITVITLPPTYVVHLDPERILSIQTLITAGSATSPSLVNKWKEKVTYINAYGPTETTICATTWVATKETIGHSVPIGAPIQNTQIYIVDENLQLKSVGEAGELCIGGEGLARGYWKRPELTSQKFVDNPFVPGEKLYKTGDQARWLPDGNIEYLGRIDNQVKIRGHRVELEEVESILLKHMYISETAVSVHKDHQEQPYLCAYFVSEKHIPLEQLRQFSSEELPTYMIPSYFIQLDKMPLTSNGKIDRKQLPEPDLTFGMRVDYEAPRNEIEETLVTIWQDVLGIEKIGIKDNFYALGGDSIKAIQVAARLHSYQLKLETKDLLKYPTIDQLVHYIKDSKRRSEQGIVEGEIGLTPIQHWFFEQQFTNMHHWNQSYMLYRPNGFDKEILLRVFNKIVEHHDALRMIYKHHNGKIVQINRGLEGTLFDFYTFDLTANDNEQQVICEESARLQNSINLEVGPLVKIALFHTQNGDHLFMAIHHLVVDGISWRILFEDLATAYEQAMHQQTIALPEKTDSFKDWSIELEKYANSELFLEEAEYWHHLNYYTENVQIKKDYVTMNNKQKNIRYVGMELTIEETEKLLKNVNKAYRTEINDILLTALGFALKEWADIDKIVINLEGHGREEILEQMNIARTVGWFTSQYPVVLDMQKSDDLSYQIKLMKENLRRIPNKGIGYEIFKYLTTEYLRPVLPFTLKPEINFNYLGQFDTDVKTELFTRSPYSMGNSLGPDGKNNLSPEGESYFVLNINGFIEEGKLHITFSYNEQQYKEDTIQQLSRSYKQHLLAIIEHCVQKEDTELTPSDFSFKELELEEMDDIFDLLADSLT